MKIDSRTLVSDYKALKAGRADEASFPSAEIVSNQTDNDPSTRDELVASSWSGSFSDSGTTLRFAEQNNRLEFSASHCDYIGAEESVGTATVDLSSGNLLSFTNGGGLEFIDGAAIAPTPAPVAPQPSAEEREAQALRDTYGQLKDAVAGGRDHALIGMGQYDIVESSPGYIKAESFGGSMSDPTCTETFKEVDGKLEWTKFTPGSPWMVGSEDSTVTRTISL